MVQSITQQTARFYQLPYLTFDNNESPLDFKISSYIDNMVKWLQPVPTQPPSTGTQLNDAAFSSIFPSNAMGLPFNLNNFMPTGFGAPPGMDPTTMDPTAMNPMGANMMSPMMMGGPQTGDNGDQMAFQTQINATVANTLVGPQSMGINVGSMDQMAFMTHINSLVDNALAGVGPAMMMAQQMQQQQQQPGATDTNNNTDSSSGNTNVDQAVDQAVDILIKQGVPPDKINKADIKLIIQHESAGNPNAVNNTDSNAAAGTPSKGLMQVIQPTFNQYKLPGHDNIMNPTDNIIAGVRYAIARYGSVSNVPGVKAVHSGGQYVGY